MGHAVWRDRGTPCPIDEEPAGRDKCMDCRFFRGASSRPGEGGWARFNCNFPVDGTYRYERPIPDVFVEGMK